MSACEYWPGCSCGLCCAATAMTDTNVVTAAAIWRRYREYIGPRSCRDRFADPGLRIAVMLAGLLVLVTDEFDHLVFGRQTLRDANRPRRRVRLRIVNGDVDAQRAVVEAREALGQFQ